LININKVTTDSLVAGFFYLICGLLLRIASGRPRWKTYLGLGLTLGLTYLTKLFLLPLCLLFLVIAWRAAKQTSRYVASSAIAFVVVAAPFITALSIEKGRFTYGEAATYDYAVSVNRIPRYHWQGDAGTHLVHPTRQIFSSPAVFEFREPLKGTFPPQFDISYWYEGIHPQISFLDEGKVLAGNFLWEFETVFFALNGALIATLFLVFYQSGLGRATAREIRRYWFLIVPCLFMAVLHALVYYSAQYLAATFVVLLVCLFLSASVSIPKSSLFGGVAVLYLLMFMPLVAFPLFLHAFHIHPLHSYQRDGASYYVIARKATEMGLRPGDLIASLNDSNFGTSEWAHLARVQIVAELPYMPPGQREKEPNYFWNADVNNFWKADPETQEMVLEKLAQTGARAVISQDMPMGPGAHRWREIGATGYYLCWLPSAESDP
jgi:hypothetical protein